MAHTPRPWRLRWSQPLNTTLIEAGDSATGYTYIARDISNDNARLIAAAPDLLAALKMWMELETTCDGRRPCYCDDPEIAKHGKCYACIATDAIAKAEGVTMEGTNGKERSLD
jgi:hypothetical protein